ncbi:MAG: helix-turn-helix transcriptional regulator, partial [Planctomycetes bacterium]|nr:helix-turn-helix transcriptional regulator [Planctomycetota bacterium]
RVPAPWACRYLMLAGPWAERIAARLEDGLLVEPRPPAAITARFLAAIDGVLMSHAEWDWQLAGMLADLALWISSQDFADGDLLLAVGRLVDANPDEPWPLATVAKRLGLGVDAFDHRFRQRSGCATARWIRARRIAHAQRLMAAGASDRAAAEAIGMDPPAFSRAFLAVTGQRPSAWRQRLTAW